MHDGGIDICYETARHWAERFGLLLTRAIRQNRTGIHTNWPWHLDDVFVKINGERFYLWRADDNEGEVLERFATRRRDKQLVLKFLVKAMKKYAVPNKIIADKLRSYGPALKDIGAFPFQSSAAFSKTK